MKAAKDKVARLFSERNKMAVMLAIENEGIKKRDAAIKKQKKEIRRRNESLKSRLREEERLKIRLREVEVIRREVQEESQKKKIENLRENLRAASEDYESARTDHKSEIDRNERLEGCVKHVKDTLSLLNQPNEASKRVKLA